MAERLIFSSSLKRLRSVGVSFRRSLLRDAETLVYLDMSWWYKIQSPKKEQSSVMVPGCCMPSGLLMRVSSMASLLGLTIWPKNLTFVVKKSELFKLQEKRWHSAKC